MSADPRFIARLIQQLDAQMHAMQDEKKRREGSMSEDLTEIERINKEISTHVQPQIVEYSYHVMIKRRCGCALTSPAASPCEQCPSAYVITTALCNTSLQTWNVQGQPSLLHLAVESDMYLNTTTPLQDVRTLLETCNVCSATRFGLVHYTMMGDHTFALDTLSNYTIRVVNNKINAAGRVDKAAANQGQT